MRDAVLNSLIVHKRLLDMMLQPVVKGADMNFNLV